MPEKVLIAGATGLIGTALAASCARDGLDRGRARARYRRARRRGCPGATLLAWDGAKGRRPPGAFEGVDVVVNLVGEPIGGAALVGGAQEARCATAASSRRARSSTRIRGRWRAPARPHPGLGRRASTAIAATRSSPRPRRRAPGFLAELARDWEAEAEKAAELGVRVVVLRNGPCSRARAASSRKMLPLVSPGRWAATSAAGRQWLPWIHIEDEIGLIRHAMATDVACPACSTPSRPSR